MRREREPRVQIGGELQRALLLNSPDEIRLGILPGHIKTANKIGLRSLSSDPLKPKSMLANPIEIATNVLELKEANSNGFIGVRNAVFSLLHQEVANAISGVGIEELVTVTAEVTNKYLEASSGQIGSSDIATLDLYVSLTRNALSQIVAAATVLDILQEGKVMPNTMKLVKLEPGEFDTQSDAKWLRDTLPSTEEINKLAHVLTLAEDNSKMIIAAQETQVLATVARRGTQPPEPSLQDALTQIRPIVKKDKSKT